MLENYLPKNTIKTLRDLRNTPLKKTWETVQNRAYKHAAAAVANGVSSVATVAQQAKTAWENRRTFGDKQTHELVEWAHSLPVGSWVAKAKNISNSGELKAEVQKATAQVRQFLGAASVQDIQSLKKKVDSLLKEVRELSPRPAKKAGRPSANAK